MPADPSAMYETMASQPSELARILADTAPVAIAADRIRGARRILLAGTGTSWHAANQGAYLLRAAGREAWAIEPFAAASGGPAPASGDALILLSHRNSKQYTTTLREQARAHEIRTVVISGIGAGGEIETVAAERSSAFTASHLGAVLRIAQLARELGAGLEGLEDVPASVERALERPAPGVRAPARLLEFTGAGTNAWTAAEGALKTRETAYVATEGLSAEQLLHGPSVALGPVTRSWRWTAAERPPGASARWRMPPIASASTSAGSSSTGSPSCSRSSRSRWPCSGSRSSSHASWARTRTRSGATARGTTTRGAGSSSEMRP